MGDTEYSFQKQGADTIRTAAEAEIAAKVLLARLKCPTFDSLRPEDQRLLLELMKASVLNIDWYDASRSKETNRKRLYIALSLVLLIVVPLAIYWGSNYVGNGSAPGLFTALISGVIAFHKSFSSWYKTRLRAGAFWSAGASIKDVLFSLEGKYDDGRACESSEACPEAARLTPEFREAVLIATAACRKIERDEREDFFAREALPDFDLSALTMAKADAAKLVAAFRSDLSVARDEAARAALTQAQAIVAAEKAVPRAQAVHDSLVKLAEQLSTKLATATAAEKPAVEAQLEVVNKERDAANRELIQSRVNLAKLQG